MGTHRPAVWRLPGAWVETGHAVHRGRSTRSPRPRQAAIPPRRSVQREPRPAAPAMATEGGSSSDRR